MISASTSKTSLGKALLLIASFFLINNTYAQNDEASKAAQLQQKIESKTFVFVAQSALPLRGTMRQLTSGYDLKFLVDSVVRYLPFFGRAYVAPMGSNETGIQFTSTEFTYSVKTKKKGWDVSIQPKDARDIRRLDLSISKGGYARLQVISNNRDIMAFSGYIE